MGSPPALKRSTVEPLTVMMSSLPSLSQSISPTPPLIDSTMYFLSGEEMCGTVRPTFCATSSNCGIDCGLGLGVFCGGEFAGGLAGEDCASSAAVSNPIPRESVHTESKDRIGRGSIIQGRSYGAGRALTGSVNHREHVTERHKTKRPRLSYES